MTEHAVVIAGGGPTGMMLAADSRAAISRLFRVVVVMVWVLRKAFRVVITLRRGLFRLIDALPGGM